MSDFPQIVKYLDIVKSRKITSAEADEFDGKASPLSKYQHILSTRAIKKIFGYLYLPNHLEPTTGTNQRGFIGFQYNYSLAGDFYLTNYADLMTNAYANIFNNCDVCIRYRVGGTVFRYHLGQFFKPFAQDFLYVPQYAGEVIKKNFTIEVWVQYDITVFSPNFGIDNPNDVNGIKLLSGRFRNPSTPDELEYSLGGGTLVKDDLFITLPETIPTIYPADGPNTSN